MKRLTSEELRTLESFQNDNYRGVTNGNVTNLVSILGKMEPEVAKTLIEQMPDAIRSMTEIANAYSQVIVTCIESSSNSVNSCYETEDSLINAFAQEMSKDIPIEDKKFFAGYIVDAAIRKEDKESEHRNSLFVFLGSLFGSLGIGAIIGGSIVACYKGKGN